MKKLLGAVCAVVIFGFGSFSAFAGDSDIQLVRIGTYTTGFFDEGAAEIVAHDPVSQRLFVVNGGSASVDILSIADPTMPTLVTSIALTPGAANSVAVFGGLVAVAVQAEVVTDPGTVQFFDVDGTPLGQAPVGSLPDMLTFTPDGTRVIVANEGEPDGGVNPPGSISIVDVSAGPGAAIVTTLGFDAFDGREADLRGDGVRLFPGVSPSLDFEPEYIAIAPNGQVAFATLQEANAFAVIDLVTPEIVAVLPLGLKDHSGSQLASTNYSFPPLPVLGTTATVNPSNPAETTPGQQILLGGLSGLWFEGVDATTGHLKFVTVPDRGPNGEPTDVDGDLANERPFALPEYQARIVRFELDPVSGAISLTGETLLTRNGGTLPITGLPNLVDVDEEPVDLWGNLLPRDPYGADLEGVVITADGTYWMCDEYRPAIYHFDATGDLIERYVPSGTAALVGETAGTFGAETLPAEYSRRRANRGFEAIAWDHENDIVYAFIQTPLNNPTGAVGGASDVIRVLGIDLTGTPVAEYVYLLEKPDFRQSTVDKIGDAVYAGNGVFYVAERDSSVSSTGKKLLFRMSLLGATNLLAQGAPDLPVGETLEQQSPDALAALGIRPVDKVKVANLPSVGYLAGDKVEGVALLPDGRLAIINDNDFGLLPEPIPGDGTVAIDPSPTQIVLGILDPVASNALDPSDRDEAIAINSWPVYGMYMPDSITAFEHEGVTYYATANEGDARDADARVEDLVLDPTAFPEAATLQQEAMLGRLEISTIDGDVDGDGDHDRIHSYGARSFTIWDEYGNLVWDSADELEQITAAAFPEFFNATNDDNDSFDSRSDAKGPEPEAITTGEHLGRRWLFLGLERIGGVMVYDLTDPIAPRFVQYVNDRDFTGDAEMGTAGDLGPEGIIFVPASESPIAAPLVIVANEISGSTSVYEVTIPAEFTRGNCNGDALTDIADAVTLLTTLFPDGSMVAPLGCRDACDANDDGRLDIADAVQVLEYLYAGGRLAGPLECGLDPTADALSCESFSACP